MTPNPHHNPPRAIGYVRVSTGLQAQSGLGLESQRSVIRSEAGRRGWDLELIEDAGVSAKNLNRPGITRALAMLDSGEADILVVAKLDRVSRSVADGAALLRRARENEWSLVALDLQLDTTTSMGNFAANMVLAFAELERDMASERTKAALAAKKARGGHVGGVSQYSDDTIRQILTLRRVGMSMGAIAAWLQYRIDEYPTAREGAHWHASTVHGVLKSRRAFELAQSA